MRIFYGLVFVAVVASLLFVSVPSASAQCLTGNITAELQTSGPFVGLWKYTLQLSWLTDQGLSNVTLNCGFGDCPEEACLETYAFDTPAGTSDGVPAPCDVDYEGEFNCMGNPSIGFDFPVIKWDALDTGNCEPGMSGTASLSFYTNLPPVTNGSMSVILVKNGLNICQETVTGMAPAICSVPSHSIDWGAIKAKYDE